jgi:hypothetical protein
LTERVEILAPQDAVAIRTEGSYRIMKLGDKNKSSCQALIIATDRRNATKQKSCGAIPTNRNDDVSLSRFGVLP